MRSKKLHGKKVTLHTAATSLPSPSLSTDGQAITTWGNHRPDVASIAIDSDGVGTLGNAYLCGYDAQDAAWRAICQVHRGATITLSATLGHEERVLDIGAFDSLAVKGTLTGGIAVTISIKPIERL